MWNISSPTSSKKLLLDHTRIEHGNNNYNTNINNNNNNNNKSKISIGMEIHIQNKCVSA
jgi:hypothetical protein